MLKIKYFTKTKNENCNFNFKIKNVIAAEDLN